MENKTAKINKRPVTKTMRNMNVGDVEYFPVEQYRSCLNAPTQGLVILRQREGRKWSVKLDGTRCKVTRTA